MSELTAAPAAPERLGPCRVLHPLGTGGAGTVYLAELAEDRPYAPRGTRVAVKVLHPSLLQDTVATTRFLREAHLGLTIVHPAVVRTFETGTVHFGPVTYHFLILEYVAGQTLRELMNGLKRVPEALLRPIAAQIASGLAAIHGATAVHRDLKPRNVLITPDHQVKIMDLGVALLADESVRLTHTGHFVGTLLYCAPEQIRAEASGPSTDLYALGVILYEAATGSQPFDAPTAAAVMRRHLEHAPPRASALHGELTPFFDELLAALLEKDPARRPRSAQEVRDVLEQGEASAWWRDRRLRERPGGGPRRLRVGRDARFVGRADELERLKNARREVQEGSGRLVLIEGEAGVGKSRLADEFLGALDLAREEVHVLVATFRPGAAGPGALAEAVVKHFGEERLVKELPRHLSQAPRLVPGFLALLLGQAPAPGLERINAGAFHAALGHLVRSLASERPVVWVIENLECAPADVRSRLPALVWALADKPVLLVCTTRPGLPAEEVSALERLGITRRLTLGRLSPRETKELLHDVLGSHLLADQLAMKVAARQGGNPFFVLETVRDLKERRLIEPLGDGSFAPASSLTRIDLPSSVRELLLARVGSIGIHDRSLLEAGAVQGQPFDPDLIARVLSRNRLEVLQRLSELERRHGVIRASGSGFGFDSQQLRDVIYDGLPAVLREEYHALLAAALAARDGHDKRPPAEVPGEAAVFLAEHFLRGQKPEEALRYLDRAFEHLEVQSRAEATAELAGLALAGDARVTAERRTDLRLRQAEALRLLGRRADELRAVEDAVRSAPDTARVARARRALGRLLFSFSDYRGSRQALAEAVASARQAGDAHTEARALGNLGNVHLSLGELDNARAEFGKSLDLCRRNRDRSGEVRAVLGTAAVHAEQGEHRSASDLARLGLELSRDLGDPQGEVRARLTHATVLLRGGEAESARQELERALSGARRLGDRIREAVSLLGFAQLFRHEGRLGDARDRLRPALALFRELVDRRGEVTALLVSAEVALDEGRLAEAEQALSFSVNVCRALGTRELEARSLRLLGMLSRARGQDESALAAYRKSLECAAGLGDRRGQAFARVALGQLLVERGEDDAARLELEDAVALAERVAPFEVLPLAMALEARLGDRDPKGCEPADGAPLAIRADAYLCLHAARRRGDDGLDALGRARALLMAMASHLDASMQPAFFRHNPSARALRAAEEAGRAG